MAFPTAPILDTFTDPSAPRGLPTYSANWSAPFVTGEHFSPQTQVGGTVTGESGGINSGSLRTDISAEDLEVYATVTVKPTVGSFFELVARGQGSDATNAGYYLAAFNNAGTDSLELWVGTPGSGLSQVGVFAAVEYNVSDVIGMSVIGTTITCYKNGTQVGSPITDSSVTGAGKIGMRLVDTTVRLDNFGGGAPVTAAYLRHSIGMKRPVVYT